MLPVFKRTIVNPLREFFRDSRSIGIVLLICTAFSVILANSFVSIAYRNFWNADVFSSHTIQLPHSFLHWINDGFMAVFFFQVGMEIKRELLHGELSSIRKSILPIVAALGGIICPAFIYLLFNNGTNYSRGWGIPTATDIAFSLGIASLLGRRVPVALKVFLTALAIIDDLGAIIVIALFYGVTIHPWFLLAAAILFLVIFFIGKLRSFGLAQIVCGILLWYCIYQSGIHAAIAGVAFAFLVPMKDLPRLEHGLHIPVYFIIMPLFALANTAIVFPEQGFQVLGDLMPVGIMLALFIGKPLGITLSSWLMVRFKFADLPQRSNWKQLIGAGILAGIGFTMSIFITTLAFTDPGMQDIGKLAVLVTSCISMIVGYLWLSAAARASKVNGSH